MTFFRAILLAALASSTPAWAVNKCTGPDGKVSFQDAPCAVASASNRDDLAELRKAPPSKPGNNVELVRKLNAEAAEAGNQAALERQRAQTDLDRICKGKSYERPLVGMTEVLAMSCLNSGQPMLVQETQSAGSVLRQYAYERTSQGVRHLYTRNGVVTVVQR